MLLHKLIAQFQNAWHEGVSQSPREARLLYHRGGTETRNSSCASAPKPAALPFREDKLSTVASCHLMIPRQPGRLVQEGRDSVGNRGHPLPDSVPPARPQTKEHPVRLCCLGPKVTFILKLQIEAARRLGQCRCLLPSLPAKAGSLGPTRNLHKSSQRLSSDHCRSHAHV